MARNCTECNHDQDALMPISMKDKLPDGHLAWFVADAGKQMDLAPFDAASRPEARF